MTVQTLLRLMTGVLVLVIGISNAAAQVSSCVAPPANLVSWYRGENNGNDSGPGANHAVAQGTVNYAAAEVGNGFLLTGAGYLQAPSVAALGLASQITLAAWVIPNATGGRVIDKISVSGHDGWLLDTYGGVVRLIVGNSVLSGTTLIPTGVPSLIAGTYDGARLRVYINGALDNISPIAPTAIPTNALPLRIGGDQNGVSLFNGTIDEADIYSRALSLSELQALYNAGSAGKCFNQPVPAMSPSLLGLLVMVIGFAGAIITRRSLPAR